MMSISNLLISNAYAEGAAPANTASFMDFIPLIGLAAVFYFLILRPQMKRAKEMKILIAALQKGDEVVTAGGELGRVTKVSGNYVTLEIATNVEVLVQKATIQTLLPKGTMKSIEKE